MSEHGYIGIWRKVLPIGEFKFAVAILHIHASGRAARILYSFRPFHDLDSPGPVFGHWTPTEGPRAVMKLGSAEEDFHLFYIPDRQLEVRYLAGREIYERATAQEISVTHLNLLSGVDFNEQIQSYLEHGVAPPRQDG
jgi:hypothetical protein